MHSMRAGLLTWGLGLFAFAAQAQMPIPSPETTRHGAGLFALHCAMCHDNPQSPRTPNRTRLAASKSADYVLRVLTRGAMREQASALSTDEKNAIAAYLTGKLAGDSGVEIDINANRCTHEAPPLAKVASSWNGWGGRGTHNLRYQPDPGLLAEAVPRLKLRWAFALFGGASSQPTVIGRRVFVPSLGGIVYSLDADSGCTYWATDVGTPVRTAISIAPLPGGGFAAYLGDANGVVHALDAESGKDLWQTVVDDHPARRLTGAPVVFRGRVYQPVSSFEESYVTDPRYACCSFRGSLVALDAATGRIVWKTYTIDETPAPIGDGHRMGPAGAAIWSAPTVDTRRGLVYAGTGNAYTELATPGADAVIAFDLRTGKKRWVKRLRAADAYVVGCESSPHVNCPRGVLGPDFDIGSSPMLVSLNAGRDLLVVTSKSGEVFGLDPARQGAIVWRTEVGRGGLLGGVEWGGASDGTRLYVTVSDHIPVRQPPMPGVSALSPTTGALIWRTPAPAPGCAWSGAPCSNSQVSAPVAIPGIVFAGSFDGHVRAYSSIDGRIAWDFDTGASFDGVNGARATGGSIDQGGQTIAGGRLFVTSGARLGQPGNALLAFSVDGK